VAHRQQARSWELRAALSLARLWQQQGKRQDAYELLAPAYYWFTERFDTADLREAMGLGSPGEKPQGEEIIPGHGGVRVEGACKRPILYISPCTIRIVPHPRHT
jgi:hypothetical protein